MSQLVLRPWDFLIGCEAGGCRAREEDHMSLSLFGTNPSFAWEALAREKPLALATWPSTLEIPMGLITLSYCS